MIVSRPLPAPAEVERMASIIFASDVQTVDNWYPVRSGARLMADGTGRFAEFECHPDEQVEAIRWLNCCPGCAPNGRQRGSLLTAGPVYRRCALLWKGQNDGSFTSRST